MAEKYYSILTNRGKELEAQSSATGKPVIIKDFVVGDGNGQSVNPDPARTKLVREVYRNAISALQVSPDQANQFIAQLVLAAGVGGFVVREVGLLTDAGELYSVANCPAIEKPENGVSVNLQYRLAVSETANIELKVATGDGLFLRIDKNLSEIAAKGQAAQKSSREAIGVVDASITAKGLVQLSSSVTSDSEALGATPKAVKVAYDLAKEKYTAQDATTAQKGIIQLSSATASTSEVLAATPKAVKTVNDELAAVKKTLGTASGKDVVTSTADTTAGRVPIVGWMGWGSVAGLNITDANTPNYNCVFKMGGEGIHGPVANAPSNILQFQYDTNAGQQIGYRTGVADAAMNHRSKINGVWGNWIQVFDTLHPPTAAQVGALPSTGGRLTGDLEIFDTAPIVQLTETDTGKRYFIVVDGSEFRIQEDSTSGNRILAYGGASKILSTVGQLVPGDYANFDGRFIKLAGSGNITGTLRSSAEFQTTSANSYRMVGGNYGTFWRQDGSNLYLMLTNSGDQYGSYNSLRPFAINLETGYPTMSRLGLSDYTNFDARYYTKTLSDAGYMAKTNAYTKAESDGRFQPKGSYAAPNNASIGTNSWFKDTGTGYMHQSGLSGTVSSGGTVTFPVPFTSKCTAVNANTYNASGSGAVMIQSMSNTGFTFAVSGGYTGQLVWNAMGK